jgi:hypothetical protein
MPWWAHLDSNQEPTDYESAALTVELWAPVPYLTHSPRDFGRWSARSSTTRQSFHLPFKSRELSSAPTEILPRSLQLSLGTFFATIVANARQPVTIVTITHGGVKV